MFTGFHLELRGSARNGFTVAVEADKTLVERMNVSGKHVGAVVPRVHGDEEALDARGVIAQETDGLAEGGHRGRAYIRAARVAEVQRNHFAVEIGELQL